MVAANTRVGNVTNFVCGIESATHQIAAGPEMFRPWQDDVAESIIGSSLETLQSTFFDEIISELTETESNLIVAEARSGYDGKPYVGETRTVAVAIFEAYINYSTNN